MEGFWYDFCDLTIVEEINQVAKSVIDGTAKRAERLSIAARLDGSHNTSLCVHHCELARHPFSAARCTLARARLAELDLQIISLESLIESL